MSGVIVIGKIDLFDKATKDDVTVVKHYNRCGYHKFSVPFMISREKAADLQGKLCYPPEGYGLYDFKSTPSLTTWQCSNSCD